MGRFKNRLISKLYTRLPFLSERSARHIPPLVFDDTPWARFEGSLNEAKVAIVTTAGVHLKGDRPFDMQDQEGDATFRVIPSGTPVGKLTITHDYYDHSDADKDINIVFPIERLAELSGSGFIGPVASMHYGFMGHIAGKNLDALLKKTAPEVASRLKAEGVTAVILTPG